MPENSHHSLGHAQRNRVPDDVVIVSPPLTNALCNLERSHHAHLVPESQSVSNNKSTEHITPITDTKKWKNKHPPVNRPRTQWRRTSRKNGPKRGEINVRLRLSDEVQWTKAAWLYNSERNHEIFTVSLYLGKEQMWKKEASVEVPLFGKRYESIGLGFVERMPITSIAASPNDTPRTTLDGIERKFDGFTKENETNSEEHPTYIDNIITEQKLSIDTNNASPTYCHVITPITQMKEQKIKQHPVNRSKGSKRGEINVRLRLSDKVQWTKTAWLYNSERRHETLTVSFNLGKEQVWKKEASVEVPLFRKRYESTGYGYVESLPTTSTAASPNDMHRTTLDGIERKSDDFTKDSETNTELIACKPDENPTYAYMDENNQIVFIIDKNTTHPQLGQLMNIQKCRESRNQPRLKLYAVKRRPCCPSCLQVIRIIEDGERIPLTFVKSRKNKESKSDIIHRAFSIMQEEIEKEGIVLLDHSSRKNDENSTTKNEECSKSHAARQSRRMEDFKFPKFVEPCLKRLRSAHGAIERFLPPGDCEPFDSVHVAKRYYEHFRPDKVRVILLAESHAYTDDDSLAGSMIGYHHVPTVAYDGPREYVALVYCLAYGEESILEHCDPEKSKFQADSLKSKGTPQFWKLFAACAGEPRNSNGSYGNNVLKSNTSTHQRIQNKLNILQRLKDRGIWLIDTSIVAWYISQPTEYSITQSSKMVHKREKARPPSNMKRETLLLSWELYIKHEVQKAAKQGYLRLFVPIGKEVKDSITRERFLEAVTVEDASNNQNNNNCFVHDGIPAPNAWIPGKNGFDLVLSELATVVNAVIGDPDATAR